MNQGLITLWKTIIILGGLVFFPMVVFVAIRALKDLVEMSKEMRKR
jgi:hypothetical protein